MTTEKLITNAENGDAESQYRLAIFLSDADEPDIFAALSWHTRAAAQGHAGAKQALSRLDTLTREILNLA